MSPIKRILLIIFLTAAASCIDPYIPDLKNYKSLLVVEGLITNKNNSYKIKLCRTTSRQDADPEKVTDANVYITDGDGIKTTLRNNGDGYYITDSTTFTGVIGRKYTLHISTMDGKEYKSEECTMLPVADIDTIYYEKGEELSGNMGELYTGLKIFLNSSDATGMNQYFRWTFEEVWKFIIPNPQRYIYFIVNDTTFHFENVPVLKDICWKKNRSAEIIINSVHPGETNYVQKQQIHFIAPVRSDRLTKQYSILVKQYSISKKEYDFWDNLKKVNEAGGDIFNSQPYSVISNIHNINDVNEMVLGYFEVSAISEKRIYITVRELDKLNLPHYENDCVDIAKSPDDWPVDPKPSWDQIYRMYTLSGEYIFVMPVVRDGTVPEGSVFQSNLLKLVFSKKVCSLCEYTGFAAKPDFWIDME